MSTRSLGFKWRTRLGTLGANSFKFTGYFKGKALNAGSYRLSGEPTNAAGSK